MGQRQSVVKAAGKGDFSRVKSHLKKKGKAALYEKEPGGWTALHKAARAGKVEMVGFLLENNADIDATDASMCTPLHCACWKGHVDVVEHLLQAGANATALTESGWSPLHTAAFRGHASVAEYLLGTPDVDASQRDLMGYTPLELAEQEEVVRILEQHVYKAIEEALDQAEDSLQSKVAPGQSSAEPSLFGQDPTIYGAGGLDVNAMLGLPADASGEEVKAAYRRLAGKHRQTSVHSMQDRRAARTRRLSSTGPGLGLIPPPPPGRKSPELGRGSPEPEAPRDRVIRVLTAKGYDRAQVVKAMERVAVEEEDVVEAKLREWGLAPKAKGTFMRKWKGGASASASASSLRSLSRINSATPSHAGTPAPPLPSSGGAGEFPRRKGSRMSNASDAELGASALLDEIRFESVSGASSRASGGLGDGGVGVGAAGGAVTAAGVSARLLEEQNAMLRAEMEGRLPRGTASRLAHAHPGDASPEGVSREQARGGAWSEWSGDTGSAVAAGLEDHFPKNASKRMQELQAASRAHPSPSPGPTTAPSTPMPGASTPAAGGSAGWESLPLSVLKRATPEGWRPFVSSTQGLVYWHNKATKQTTWSPPPGTLSLEEAQQMAAAREQEKAAREAAAARDVQAAQEKASAFGREAAKAMSMVLDEVKKPPPPPSVSTPSMGGGPARTPGGDGGEREVSRAPSVLSRASGASSALALSRGSGQADADVQELQRAAPRGWKVYMSNTHKRPYWYNKRTRETRWTQPEAELAPAAPAAAQGGERAQEEAGHSATVEEVVHRSEEKRQDEPHASEPSREEAEATAQPRGVSEGAKKQKQKKTEGRKDGLPKGWKEYVSKTTGKVYYYNKKTNETRWTRPEVEESANG